MNIMPSSHYRAQGLARWRRSDKANRPIRPLAIVGAAAAITAVAAAIIVVGGGLLVLGLGALTLGALALAGSWLRAQRNGVWVHVLIDTDDVIISLALPIPLSLLRRGLAMTPISDDDVATVRMILEDPELLKALHEDAIEIIADDGADHIEVVIGPRRRRWRAFQLNLTRSFSQTTSLPHSKEPNHV